MHQDISFKITRTPFNEHYCVAPTTRITTNFANLARGPYREENICKTLDMISNRCNSLAHWDNSNKNRYSVTLEIVSVFINSGMAPMAADVARKKLAALTAGVRIIRNELKET